MRRFDPRRLAACLLVLWLSASATFAQTDRSPFPTAGILPKAETGAVRFLEEHPAADGRGTVVAIFDTGVDPGAQGLQSTPAGAPKILDIIDATGSGDVDTSKTAAAVNEKLTGLTGRELSINPAWKNPTGKYHLGIKAAYDIFPGGLESSIRKHRREEWDKVQRKLDAALVTEIESKNSATAREKSELKLRLEELRKLPASYSDPGPVVDCVVFHDGDVWRAVIDTDEDGDLKDEQVLADFDRERQFGTFGGEAQLNFGVHIYNDGNLLSIVTDAGPHGTHVAGIVSAYFPNQLELNGLAPGAQIVSVKIGDSRLGSMETATALERAILAVIRHRCDLINMSYGEPTSRPNQGRLVDLFREAVEKHGVIFVASAGNSGPALSTVGAPGGTTDAIFGIGAYVSPEMMAAEYTLREKLPGLPYTWTSRGPTFDGDDGVDLFAPGGAISPVPRWTRQRSMQMNGTSMASPNACGNLALLLSGLKQANIPYNAASLRRGLQNTATPIADGDRFAQGPGLVQVDRAFMMLQKTKGLPGELWKFAVTVGRSDERGILLREPHETRESLETSIRIRPTAPHGTSPSDETDFEMRVELKSSADWVQCGGHILLTEGGRSFEARVDPTGLESGVHRAEILGYDADRPERGALFCFPITVIKPLAEPAAHEPAFREEIPFQPGTVTRRFLAVPAGTTWAEVTLQTSQPTESRTFILHLVQDLADRSFEAGESKQFLRIDDQPQTLRIPVEAGSTLEICLAQFWSSLGPCQVKLNVNWKGILPDSRTISLPAESPARITVSAPLAKMSFTPSATLHTRRQLLAPKSAVITLLADPRDLYPDERRVSLLELKYDIDQSQSGTVTARLPELDDFLYDTEFGGPLTLFHDSNGQLVGTDDPYPEGVRLGRGKHTVTVQLRHTEPTLLEKLKKLLLHLDRSVSGTFAVTSSRIAAANRSPAVGKLSLEQGETAVLYISPPASAPGGSSEGNVLLGSLQLDDNGDGGTVRGKLPTYEIVWTVPPQSADRSAGSSSSGTSGSPSNPKSLAEKLEAEVLDVQISQLEKLPLTEEGNAAFERLAVAVLARSPDELRVHLARLHRLDDEDRELRIPAIVDAANAVLQRIDSEALARGLSLRPNPDLPETAAAHRKLEEQRDILVDTLYRKGRAIGYRELPEVLEKTPITDQAAQDAAFESNFAELRKWVDTTESQFVLLHVRAERRRGRFAHALSALNAQIDRSASNYWHTKKRTDLYHDLGWTHAWEWERRWKIRKFPNHLEE